MGSPPIGEGAFELHVSLHGTKSENALQVILPPAYAQLRIDKLLDSVFPEDEEGRSYIEGMLDVRENPDLPDIYAALLEVFAEWRTDRCALKFFEDHGPETELSDLALERLSLPSSGNQDHSRYPVLNLVIQQKYPALDYIVAKRYWEDKGTLIEWLQSLTLLYFLDKHEFEFSVTPPTEIERRLLTIAEALQARNFIVPSEKTGVFAITKHGRQFIGNQLAETESYIDRFDIFKDVDYDIDTGSVEFGSGRGEDLRVQIFITEGLDPVRVVFLLRLYDGTVDEFISTWSQRIHDEKFYDEILEPVMDHPRVDEGLIGRVIESGYSHTDERREEAREILLSREILQRVAAKQDTSSDREEQNEC